MKTQKLHKPSNLVASIPIIDSIQNDQSTTLKQQNIPGLITNEKRKKSPVKIHHDKNNRNLTSTENESEMNMFYFSPESPTKRTLLKNKTQRIIKGFYRHLLPISSTPNPENKTGIQNDKKKAYSQPTIESKNHNETTFYFRGSPDDEKSPSDSDNNLKFKPLSESNQNLNTQPSSYQYQHQNIFKTILKSKNFQTLKKTGNSSTNKANETKVHFKFSDSIIAKADNHISYNLSAPNMNVNSSISNILGIKSRLKKSNIQSDDNVHDLDSSKNVTADLSNDSSFNQIGSYSITTKPENTKLKSRTKEKFKAQLKELVFGEKHEEYREIAKVIKNLSLNEIGAKTNSLSKRKNLVNNVTINKNPIAKKRNSKKVGCGMRPLVGQAKTSRQILQEISVMAKKKPAAKTSVANSNSKRSNFKLNDFDDNNFYLEADLIETGSIVLNNDGSILTDSSAPMIYNISSIRNSPIKM